MQPKTLFRIMVRAIGVLLLAEAIPSLLNFVVQLVSIWQYSMRTGASSYDIIRAVPPVLQIVFGIYLLTGPRWIVNLAVKDNLPHCYECGYSLQGLPASGKCPECGTPYYLESPIPAADAPQAGTDQGGRR